MRLTRKPATQRLRLSLLAALYSAVLLAILFLFASQQFRRAALRGSYDLLKPAAELAMRIYHERPLDPDWYDLTYPNPDLSIAVFDQNGEFLDSAGSIVLRPVDGRAIGVFNKISATYFTRRDNEGRLYVVALPWAAKQREINRFKNFSLGLYVFLVIAAGAVTWQASKSTFRPLADLAEQAEQLSATDLSRRLNLAGSGEYAVVAAHLNRFLELLQAGVQRQERFVSDAAHELRTPLTVIRGQIETALLRARTPEDYRNTLQVALNEAERLSRLVEGLLLSASAPVVQPAPIDIETAMERAHARWLDRFSNAGVELIVDESPPVNVAIRDEECDSILDNLLSNALKHSNPGTTTRVSLATSEVTATLTVDDEGSGIPEALRASLFDRFTRGDTSRNRELGGFGIGLSVVKRLVQARGGEVHLAPSEIGAKFVVELPLAS